MTEISTFNEVLAAFGGPNGLHKAMNKANPGTWFSHQRLYAWRKTQKFPRDVLHKVIAAAEYANIEGIDLHVLYNLKKDEK